MGTEVTEANLAEFVSGLLVTNDVSARDIQLTKAQFYESKSYPTFTPVGPALVLVNADELKRFGDLRLQLRVNGELRQNMVVEGDMLTRPSKRCRHWRTSRSSMPATWFSPVPRSAPRSPRGGSRTRTRWI